MESQRVNKAGSWSSQTPQKAPPLVMQAQPVPGVALSPDSKAPEIEEFEQHKFEATTLGIKQKYGVITPVEQANLGVLQAKMDGFWAQRRERTQGQSNWLERSLAESEPVSEPASEPASKPIIQRQGASGADEEEQQGGSLALEAQESAGAEAEAEEQQGEDLTLEDEEKILQAKFQIQRKAMPDAKPLAQIQRQPEVMIQRAWAGRRQLSGLGGLGKPWIWRKRGNIANLGLYHEHIFFEDGGTPADIGHMGKQGLGQDTDRMGDYAKFRKGMDDAKMREAVSRVQVKPGEYSLLSNNCQKYVMKVLDIYDSL